MSLLANLRSTDLISPTYRELQRELHARPNGYGGKGSKWAREVADLVAAERATSVLDYGCGQGTLKQALRSLVAQDVRIDEYDPAVTGKEKAPEFADVVVATDVLEHIEPDRLTTVLQHLKVLARKAVFVVINSQLANKTLADGRNAHLIIEAADWWLDRFHELGFTLEHQRATHKHLEAVFRT